MIQCSSLRRSRFAAACGVAVLLGVGCPGKSATEANPGAPQLVVLVTVEGLGRDLVAGLPDGSAPVLRELLSLEPAGEPFYTPYPVLLPATVSLMTGLPPLDHKVFDNSGARLGRDIPTLAEEFLANGWSTAAFVGSPLVSWLSGLDRGFEVFDGAPGFAFGGMRHYPQIRPASEVVESATRWLRDLPAGRPGFIWVHLSDLARPPEIANDHTFSSPRAKGIVAVDGELAKLRAALRERGQSALLVLTSDRVQVEGSTADLGQGFFVDPAWSRVPLVLERIGRGKSEPPPPARPLALTGLGSYLEELAGLGKRRLPSSSPSSAESTAGGARLVSASAVPWIWCRWSAAAAALDGGDLWIFDGSWRRTGADGKPAEVPAAEVPETVQSLVRETVARLSATPPPGPKVQQAISLAEARGVALGKETAAIATPAPEARRDLIEALQRARAAIVTNRPVLARRTLRQLEEGAPAMPAAILDRALFESGGSPEAAWQAAQKALATFGPSPLALHWAAHTSLHGDRRDLAEAFLHAYLEREPGEPDALYDLACARSLAGDLDGAESYLRQAIENGFRYWELAENDKDLRNLRADPRFAAVMRKR